MVCGSSTLRLHHGWSVPRKISAACALFLVVAYWHAWASTGDLFLRDLQLAPASSISLLLSDGTCVENFHKNQ